MVPQGARTIPAGDLGKLESLQWDAELLSVRDTLRAAGLIFPFDRHWSAEERSRRRSQLGDQMAYRLIGGAKKRSELVNQGPPEFEANPAVQMQREILAETDAIDRRFPPREEASDPSSDAQREILITPPVDPVEQTQRPSTPAGSPSPPPPPPPPSRKRRLKKAADGSKKKKSRGGKPIIRIDSSETSADDDDLNYEEHPQESASEIPSGVPLEVEQPPTVDLNQHPEVAPSPEIPPETEITVEELQAEPTPELRVEVEAANETEIPLEEAERPEIESQPEANLQSQEIPRPDGIASTTDASAQASGSQPEVVARTEVAPENPVQTSRRRNRGKQVVLEEYDEEMARRCNAQPMPSVRSGPGGPSQVATEEVDPNTGMPVDWPYDHPKLGDIAAYDFRGFFGYHPYPIPTADELKRILQTEEPCIMTLMQPRDCSDRDLAVLLDTVTKMNLAVGHEIFYRHRYHGQRVEQAEAAARQRSERRHREASEMASARVLSLETELARLQGELSATSSDFSNLMIASTASEATLKESLAKAQEELDTAKAECECARQSLASNQTTIETLEIRVADFDIVRGELETALKTVDELTDRVHDQSVEIDHLRGEVARLQAESQSHEADLLVARDTLATELSRIQVENAHTLAQVRNESAREAARAQEDAVRAQEDAARANKRVAELEEEAARANQRVAQLEEETVQARARNRLEGARDFRSSAVFRNLAVRLAYPMASQLWDNSIGQTSYLGGYKEDFNPKLLLDIEKDAQFRPYAEEDGLEVDPSDEFISLQYNEDEDSNIIPLGLPDGAPEPPPYPPPEP